MGYSFPFKYYVNFVSVTVNFSGKVKVSLFGFVSEKKRTV